MSRPAIVLAIIASFIGATVSPVRADRPPPDATRRSLFPIVAPPPPVSASEPTPPVTTVHRTRKGPLVGGGVLFGLSWGGAVFLSAALLNCRCMSGDRALSFSIPVFGPMVAGPQPDEPLWYLWSAAQLGSALLLGYGLKGEDVPVTGEGRATRTASSIRPELQLTPMVARDAHGMALTARW